ncbi:threonine synthase [Tissierella creatinophila]|uniref:Threonine synthase n=1 Tax=Tissierella creatinophila DSM 6911 TaxID=1123403 RepID=A0A1U7M2Z6_TISCR|nr:threonine synthase [Tissierella creatinophila]OLS01656.1 threonine synthase [Tissierella creatinophila DSM 6911]
MKYISTRNKENFASWGQAIINGISKDGGLFVPESIPKISNIKSLLNMDYRELAYEVMNKFFVDFDKDSLRNSIDKAYDEKFSKKEIAPLVEAGDLHYLELFHGATFAFKDMALSVLPYLLKEAIKYTGEEKEIVILTATSGDTGKAALENFADVEGIKIIVFFPEDGVSNIQKRQMLTQEGDNTFVVSINGDFDDAQSGVKKIMNDNRFIELLENRDYKLSSANSINIGRLVPQIVYYFYSYLNLLKEGKIKEDEKINFVVPTGNFGNILAAFYAKEMGLPINKLICASNENNVLTDFINTGTYDKRRKLILTSSPSMDILVSSNLERFLFHLSGGDDKLIKNAMESLEKEGKYEVEGLDQEDFKGYFSTEEEITSSINEVFMEHNYLMDPHTAVAHSAYKKYKLETKDNTKTVIVSTASPFKFGTKVSNSIGIDTKDKDDFSIIEKLGEMGNLDIPNAILELKDKKIAHKNNCNKEDMEKMVLRILEIGDNR